MASPAASPSGAVAQVDIDADLEAMLAARDETHPNGWHGMDREAWIAEAEGFAARASELSHDEVLVELVRLAAMPSWNGRDGHTGIFPFIPTAGTHVYPVRWWRFSDGLVITAAQPPYDELVGARVETINGLPVDEVLELVEPLAPRDNPSNLLAYGPLYLRVSELLAGLGIIDEAGATQFGVVDGDGARREITIEPVPVVADRVADDGMPHRLPATDAPWLARQRDVLWWEYLEDSGTLFVQFNQVAGGTSEVVADILERAGEDDVERVVIDLRHNGGGDNTTLHALEQALEDESINREGRLFAIIGRITFSAAANFATDIEASTSVQFVGEAMGGSPNLYGDARPVDLPASGQQLYMATRYWERSTPDDERLTIEPDIPVELSSADYFERRDPALDAILAAGTPAE